RARILGGGATGEVRLMPEGSVEKRAWSHKDAKEDLKTEARVYKLLAENFDVQERFLKFLDYKPDIGKLSLEFMECGTLRDYLKAHAQIAYSQRAAWSRELTQGLEMLHSISVIHMDLTPANMLLNLNLELKIADFACSSVGGTNPSGTGGVRFYPEVTVTFKDDIFAAGSSMYEIFTNDCPCKEICSSQVVELYSMNRFPALSNTSVASTEMANIIRNCWMRIINSAAHLAKQVEQASRD
ncbi:hypothetical protein CERZMDRAFT_10589, partial [Cercospora zeae-maydis SCOH1-5]